MFVDAWPGLTLIEPVEAGHRNEVWAGVYDGDRVVVRRSRRSIDSLSWELDLLAYVGDLGIGVAEPVPTVAGESHSNGVVVQRWIEGRAPSERWEWQLVAERLGRLHAATTGRPQRPNCCVITELRRRHRSVDADVSVLPDAARELVLEVFDDYMNAPIAVVHGDPGASNIRIDPDHRVWFLDWDESRVDVVWLDLANLGVQVLDDDTQQRARVLANAWETINAWTTEPPYARRRLRELERNLNH